MAVFCVEIIERTDESARRAGASIASQLRHANLPEVGSVLPSRLFFIEGEIERQDADRAARELLADPVTERYEIRVSDSPVPIASAGTAFEVHLRPGVTDPVAQSTLEELRASGIWAESVRTARRYVVDGRFDPRELISTVGRVLANDCIEQVVPGSAGVKPSPRAPVFDFKLRHVLIRELDGPALDRLSRDGHLFLSADEMRSIQSHFREMGREPTDLELETIAQTWSEHCVHKTLKSTVIYRGAPMPRVDGASDCTTQRDIESTPVNHVEIRYSNLLADTIARATRELMAENRGPSCLSVFKDNAGIIAFDDQYGVAFKVETHNHPSAIEPYGGAATGVGGCIRDVIGCGLGARPIANTDVFCVAPGDWPLDSLPRGVLHPARVLRNVVRGVADYGNRMGIPTVNGAVHFDPRYLGNPLVYCGCLGLIPRDKIEKSARPGDLIVVVGGRTGRDGIHGATFSSAELTDTHADEFSHAVQIGNAITEKRFLDAIMRARDDDSGCLYTAITDCGAGGLSSAIGEMAEETGATVDLEKVPLKYAGLRYDEIWISEAQERMVLAVPRERVERLMRIMGEEQVEATVIGEFGSKEHTRLVIRYNGQVVGDLDMRFIHHGIPKIERVAEWWPQGGGSAPAEARATPEKSTIQPRRAETRSTIECQRELFAALKQQLSRPTSASKEWIIRQYDHEVQGGSVVKPLCGRGTGPSDAAVLRPRLDSYRGIAVGCGLAPQLSDLDPYWMAAASIDEAIRNIVCVGGDPSQTAILDNFCWGRTDDPRKMGGLVRACQACYDVAIAFGTPFISGKDSLNNEFALDEADVERVIATLSGFAQRSDEDSQRLRANLPWLTAQIRSSRRLSIPGTLLISAVSIITDVRRCVTADLKRPGAELYLVGMAPQTGFALDTAARIHKGVADAITGGHVAACHDCSEGGWLTAAAEMAIAGKMGIELHDQNISEAFQECFAERSATYVVESSDGPQLRQFLTSRAISVERIGTIQADPSIILGEHSISVADLRSAWKS